jgi:hypothetical protein
MKMLPIITGENIKVNASLNQRFNSTQRASGRFYAYAGEPRRLSGLTALQSSLRMSRAGDVQMPLRSCQNSPWIPHKIVSLRNLSRDPLRRRGLKKRRDIHQIHLARVRVERQSGWPPSNHVERAVDVLNIRYLQRIHEVEVGEMKCREEKTGTTTPVRHEIYPGKQRCKIRCRIRYQSVEVYGSLRK